MNCDRVGMPDVGYPENPTVTTVIESLKRCNEKQDSYESCKECTYYKDKVCHRIRLIDHAVLFLEMYKSTLDAQQIKSSADYFRKYREDRAEIKKRDDMIADLKSQIEALKNNAYRVGYNDGRDSEIESRRWDDYVGM